MGPVLVSDVQTKVAQVHNVTEVKVELVFDPPWDRSRMTEEAQLQLGLL
jgi:metal-sulfur cluster biosynthetic enzyme